MPDLLSNILGIVISYVFIFGIIMVSKVVSKYGTEVTRKFIHISLANWWFIAMAFFKSPIWAAFVPATFVVINYISYKKDLIKVMERDESTKDGLGTVYYAISLLILTIVTFGPVHNPMIGLVGILVMGYGDGLAAVFGKKIKSKKFKVGNKEKSVAGSTAMFIVTFVVTVICALILHIPYAVLKALIISAVLTVVEAVSIKGTDNIFVPLLASLIFGLMI